MLQCIFRAVNTNPDEIFSLDELMDLAAKVRCAAWFIDTFVLTNRKHIHLHTFLDTYPILKFTHTVHEVHTYIYTYIHLHSYKYTYLAHTYIYCTYIYLCMQYMHIIHTYTLTYIRKFCNCKHVIIGGGIPNRRWGSKGLADDGHGRRRQGGGGWHPSLYIVSMLAWLTVPNIPQGDFIEFMRKDSTSVLKKAHRVKVTQLCWYYLVLTLTLTLTFMLGCRGAVSQVAGAQ